MRCFDLLSFYDFIGTPSSPSMSSALSMEEAEPKETARSSLARTLGAYFSLTWKWNPVKLYESFYIRIQSKKKKESRKGFVRINQICKLIQ
jgi:hypothetical protein